MRAEYGFYFAGNETAQNPCTFRTGHAAGEQSAADTQASANALESAIVLFSKEFRRRHHRSLIPAFDGANHRPEGDQGFAAADVAQEHPVHLIRTCQIDADLLDRARLRTRQFERQSFEHLRTLAVVAAERDSGTTCAAKPLNRKRQLEREQL